MPLKAYRVEENGGVILSLLREILNCNDSVLLSIIEDQNTVIEGCTFKLVEEAWVTRVEVLWGQEYAPLRVLVVITVHYDNSVLSIPTCLGKDLECVALHVGLVIWIEAQEINGMYTHDWLGNILLKPLG